MLRKKIPAAKMSDSMIFQKVLGASQRLIDIAPARDTQLKRFLPVTLLQPTLIFKEDLLNQIRLVL